MALDLTKYDHVLLVDKSGSMSTVDAGSKGNKSRWADAEETTEALAREMAKYDSDGITVGVFNSKLVLFQNITGGDDKVKQIFSENSPSGGTDTALALKTVIDQYLTAKKANAETAKPILVTYLSAIAPRIALSRYPAQKHSGGLLLKYSQDERTGMALFRHGRDHQRIRITSDH